VTPEHLAEHDITPVKRLAGVGQHLQDRTRIGVVNRIERPWAALRGSTYSIGDRQYHRWRRRRTGVYTSNGLLFSAMFQSRTDRERPDLFCFFVLADFRVTIRVIRNASKSSIILPGQY